MEVPSTLDANSLASPGPDATDDFSSKNSGLRYTIIRITSEDDLSVLEPEWNHLSESAASPNVFTTYGWFQAWNRHFTEEDRRGRHPHVLVIRKGSAVVGISPLIIRRVSRFGISALKLEFVGSEADYNDLALGTDPVGQSEAVVEFLAQTQDQWDLVNLRDIRDTGNTMAQVEKALSRAGLTYRIIPEVERCPYLAIDAPWSEMLTRRSSSSRHVFRNQQSRLKRMVGEGLRVRIIENPLDEPGLLGKLIALETQKHVGGKLSPPLIGKYPELFQALFDTLGPRGWLYIALMELGDRPLAWRFGFRCGKKLWGYLTAYDHSFSNLSPGTMLIPAVIDYGLAHGCDEYDFLRGEESYKTRWSTGVHQSYWLRIWSRNWISRAHALVSLDLKPAVNRLFAPRTRKGTRK
jgi:CelD/BcsL family acetyltransferase involved in cellulose biosynthesis